MLNKTLLQGIILLASLYGLLFTAGRIDWMKRLGVPEISASTEKKIGDLFWESISHTDDVITADSICGRVNNLIEILILTNNFSANEFKVHVIDNPVSNAFAMPGGHLVVHSGLLDMCENDEELAGVICHEMAHIRKKHVMKKLRNEIGLSVLLTIGTGNSDPGLIRKTVKMLGAKAYERDMEKEADLSAVDYMLNAKLDPQGFVSILEKFAAQEHESHSDPVLEWISSHPGTADRIVYIKEKINGIKAQN